MYPIFVSHGVYWMCLSRLSISGRVSLPNSSDNASCVFDILVVFPGIYVVACLYVSIWDVSGDVVPRS